MAKFVIAVNANTGSGMSRKDIRLDVIRSIAMLYIVFVWHFCDYLAVNPEYLNILTKCILASFFLISGYLFGKIYKFNKPADALVFYKKRLLRIVPMFFLAVLTFGCCNLMTWEQVLKTFCCISVFAPPYAKTLWFMDVIIVFYLLTPWLLFKDKKWIFILVAGAFCLLMLALMATVIKIDIRLLLYFPAYCIGLFWHHISDSIFFRTGKKQLLWGGVAGILFAGVYAWAIATGQHTYAKVSIPVLVIIGLEGVLWNVAFTQGSVLFAKMVKLFTFLSYCSFAIYLFHRQFFFLIEQLTSALQLELASATSRGIFIASIPVLIFVGWGIQNGMDKVMGLFRSQKG